MGMKAAAYACFGVEQVVNPFDFKRNVFALFKGNQRTALVAVGLQAYKICFHSRTVNHCGIVGAEDAADRLPDAARYQTPSVSSCRSQIVTGALVNAKATAKYILEQNPEVVSIVPMGWEGKIETEEDTLCADYLKALLENRTLDDLQERVDLLKQQEGAKFFDPNKPQFPEEDFWLCTKVDIIDGVNVISKNENQIQSEWLKYE